MTVLVILGGTAARRHFVRRVWVHPGPAEIAVTVQGGAFSRLLGPGRPETLAPGESEFRTVSLEPVVLSGTLSGALTRDAVPIKSIEWRAECRVRAREGSGKAPEQYPFDPSAVRLAAWGPKDLESALETEIACTLAESIRSLPMDQLIDAEGRLVPLGAALESAKIVLAEALGTWGMTLVSLRIPTMELDNDIRAAISALWRTRTELRAAALTAGAPREGTSAMPDPDLSAGDPGDPAVPGREPAHATVTPEQEAAQVPTAPGRPRAPNRARAQGPAVGADSAPDRGAPAATQNPVSFSTFLRSLRERSSAGDEVATSVLNQVLDVMAKIDAPRPNDEAAGSADGAGPRQRQLTMTDKPDLEP